MICRTKGYDGPKERRFSGDASELADLLGLGVGVD
jgi:hypothetical protein